MGSWAQIYRPKTLDEYVGDKVKGIITNRFSQDSLPQVVLLHGAMGLGKTTLALLMSKMYNCLDKEGGTPCDKCAFCNDLNRRIDIGEVDIDVMGVSEIDIASEGSKANIDTIIEEAKLPPQYPLKYKVLILDEFQMANKSVQNSLLKVMEEPPNHLVFILCTTNPEAILPTILSRCQLKIEISRPLNTDIVDRLKYICDKEGIKYSVSGLSLLVNKSNRLIRETILNLETIVKLGNSEITIPVVNNYFNVLDSDLYFRFYEESNKGLSGILSLIHTLKEEDIDLARYANGLATFTLECVYIVYGYSLENHDKSFLKNVKKLFNTYSSEEIDILLEKLESTLTKIETQGNAELHIINLGLCIGRIKLLSGSVGKRKQEAEDETKRGLTLYSKANSLKTSETANKQAISELIENAYSSFESVDISSDIKIEKQENQDLDSSLLDYFRLD